MEIAPESLSEVTLEGIESAAQLVYRSLTPTAQISWPLLSERCGCEVWVKHENHLPTGAFKVRGGLVYLDWLRRTQPDCGGVIAATRGNHGQSVAFAARQVGLNATIVIPRGNSVGKNRAMKAYGADLIEQGDDFNEAHEIASALAKERGLHFVPSFDWILVLGVATYGLEFFRGAPELDRVYVPIGLGSGICGMVAAKKALGKEAEIVGVVAEGAPAYALSFASGEPVSVGDVPDTLADGVACRIPDEGALVEIMKGVSKVMMISEAAILEAMGFFFDDCHQVAEGAGAIALAAALQEEERARNAGKQIGLVLSGGNVDPDLYRRVLRERGKS